MQASGLNDPAISSEMGRATIHSLRHTFASLLLQRGASLADIQHALGHKNLTMTMRYAHLLQGESVAKLAGIMNETMGDQRG
jgi:site-specific recombinase XerD